jgi:hypothetical protein
MRGCKEFHVVEEPSTPGNRMHENRETSALTAQAVRSRKREDLEAGRVRCGGVGIRRSTEEGPNEEGSRQPRRCRREGRVPRRTRANHARTRHSAGLSVSPGFIRVRRSLQTRTRLRWLTPLSEGRAVCGSAARTDLCGGRSAMIVPTATERCRTRGVAREVSCRLAREVSCRRSPAMPPKP